MNCGGMVQDKREVKLGCLGTEEWMRVPATLQERAFFSAEPTSTEALHRLRLAVATLTTAPAKPTGGQQP